MRDGLAVRHEAQRVHEPEDDEPEEREGGEGATRHGARIARVQLVGHQRARLASSLP